MESFTGLLLPRNLFDNRYDIDQAVSNELQFTYRYGINISFVRKIAENMKSSYGLFVPWKSSIETDGMCKVKHTGTWGPISLGDSIVAVPPMVDPCNGRIQPYETVDANQFRTLFTRFRILQDALRTVYRSTKEPGISFAKWLDGTEGLLDVIAECATGDTIFQRLVSAVQKNVSPGTSNLNIVRIVLEIVDDYWYPDLFLGQETHYGTTELYSPINEIMTALYRHVRGTQLQKLDLFPEQTNEAENTKNSAKDLETVYNVFSNLHQIMTSVKVMELEPIVRVTATRDNPGEIARGMFFYCNFFQK